MLLRLADSNRHSLHKENETGLESSEGENKDTLNLHLKENGASAIDHITTRSSQLSLTHLI